jgi:hypothetical protein
LHLEFCIRNSWFLVETVCTKHRFNAYVLTASTKHADIPHILFDYHAEGGSKKLEKLDSKAVLSIPELFIVNPDS